MNVLKVPQAEISSMTKRVSTKLSLYSFKPSLDQSDGQIIASRDSDLSQTAFSLLCSVYTTVQLCCAYVSLSALEVGGCWLSRFPMVT